MAILLRLIGALPLSWLYVLGGFLGGLGYRFHGKTRLRQDENLRLATPFLPTVPAPYAAAQAAGQQVMELLWCWQADYSRDIGPRLLIDDASAHLLTAPGATIFLTPHIGAFEITAYVIGQARPLTALYRKPRLAALDVVMRNGRRKGQCTSVPADLSGVRALFKALKKGEAIGILPDQTPQEGEGVWAPMFGKPAYTMTLIASLAQKTQARLVMCMSTREQGRFRIQCEALPPLPLAQFDGDVAPTTALNAHVQRAIARCPTQYLWSYNRYKHPGGAAPPPKA